jgi:hypothetical protein
LPRGIINASETQIETASSSCERWEWTFAGLVVAGVIAEFVIAGIHPLYDSFLEQWRTATAGALVALGIVGEVIFGRIDARYQTELRKRSNDKMSNAIERAAILEKEAADARGRVADIERLTSWRHISDEQREQIASSIRHMADSLDVLIEYQIGDAEAFSYGREIREAFIDAGTTKIREGSNSYLVTIVFGVHLSSSEEINASFIVSVLNKAGVQVTLYKYNLSTHLPRNEVVPNLYIFVAPKPPPPLWRVSNADPNDPSSRKPTTSPKRESTI